MTENLSLALGRVISRFQTLFPSTPPANFLIGGVLVEGFSTLGTPSTISDPLTIASSFKSCRRKTCFHTRFCLSPSLELKSVFSKPQTLLPWKQHMPSGSRDATASYPCLIWTDVSHHRKIKRLKMPVLFTTTSDIILCKTHGFRSNYHVSEYLSKDTCKLSC